MKNPRAISKKLRFEVFKRDGFRCVYCGAGTPDVLLVVDHIDPVAKGGTRDLMNLATACEPCNAGKSDRTLSDTTVVAKRRAQADQLAEYQEQALAAMAWQRGLSEVQERVAREVFSGLPGFTMNDFGVRSATALIRETSLADVMEAVSGCAAEFIRRDAAGAVVRESWREAFEQVGKRARFAAACRKEPNLREAARIRAGLRRRVQSGGPYFWAKVLRDLVALLSAGRSPQELRERLSDCWSAHQLESSIDFLVVEPED